MPCRPTIACCYGIGFAERSTAVLAKRQQRLRLFQVSAIVGFLPGKEVGNGNGELTIAYPVQRPSRYGFEAAGDLVLALGAGIEAGEAAADGELDALIAAEFEMQVLVLSDTPPITAVEVVGVVKIQGCCHGPAAVAGYGQC